MALTQDERDALYTRQVVAAEAQVAKFAEHVGHAKRMADAAERELSVEQKAKLETYALHLRTRLGPTVITTGTGDPIVSDIVNDAYRMTEEVWPRMKTFLGL